MAVPSSLSTISATKLSLSRFSRRTRTRRASELSRARGRAVRCCAPRPGRPGHGDSRAARARHVSACAAILAEPFAVRTGRSTTVSADSGLDSIPRYDGFHPGASRRASKWLSSPSTRPSTRRIPMAEMRRASRSRSASRERRIPMADEDEIALPGATHACPRSYELRVKAKVGPEDSERGEGDGELLGRGRQE